MFLPFFDTKFVLFKGVFIRFCICVVQGCVCQVLHLCCSRVCLSGFAHQWIAILEHNPCMVMNDG
jgi:hypothetical protein